MKKVFICTALFFCAGCGVLCNPTYTPTGNLVFQDLSNIPIRLQVEDPRSEDQKVFFRYLLLGGHTDYVEGHKNGYVKMESSSREILEHSFQKALGMAGYVIDKDTETTMKIILGNFRSISPDTWDSKPDVVTASIRLEVVIERANIEFFRRYKEALSAKSFNAFRQYEDSEVVLSSCISKIVEDIAVDKSILNAIKRSYSIEVPEEITKSEGIEQPSKPSKPTYKQERIPTSQGTGFLFAKSGLVATNYHVVPKKDIWVFFPKADLKFDAKVELKDISNDLVILRLKDFTYEEVFSQEIPYDIQKSKTVQLGEKVFTLGFPLGKLLGKSAKFSDGTISSLSGLMGTANLFQINTPIQPGNSGGPLFNQHGNVIGIVPASLDAKFFYENLETIPQNVNFAIKSDYLISLISMLPENDSTLSRKGSLQDRTTGEQVDALIPYIVTVYVR